MGAFGHQSTVSSADGATVHEPSAFREDEWLRGSGVPSKIRARGGALSAVGVDGESRRLARVERDRDAVEQFLLVGPVASVLERSVRQFVYREGEHFRPVGVGGEADVVACGRLRDDDCHRPRDEEGHEDGQYSYGITPGVQEA